MATTFGLKYCTVQIEKGGVEVIMVVLNGDVVGSFEAKDFHKWLKEKVREMGEWLETGSVKKWYPKPLEIDKDRMNYLG